MELKSLNITVPVALRDAIKIEAIKRGVKMPSVVSEILAKHYNILIGEQNEVSKSQIRRAKNTVSRKTKSNK